MVVPERETDRYLFLRTDPRRTGLDYSPYLLEGSPGIRIFTNHKNFEKVLKTTITYLAIICTWAVKTICISILPAGTVTQRKLLEHQPCRSSRENIIPRIL